LIGPLVLAFDAIVGFVSPTGSFTERLEAHARPPAVGRVDL